MLVVERLVGIGTVENEDEFMAAAFRLSSGAESKDLNQEIEDQ